MYFKQQEVKASVHYSIHLVKGFHFRMRNNQCLGFIMIEFKSDSLPV